MASASEVFVYKPDKWQKPRDFLAQHLPYSVPLLRCLQYFTHGTEAVLISSFDVEISEQPIAFALAFFDHQLPAVRSWIFSSLEIPSTREIENALDDRNSINDLALECLRKVFASMRTSCKDPTMLVGSVMSIVADALRRGPLSDAIRDDLSDAAQPYGKFMLRDTQITAAFDLSLADGYAFDKVEARDYDLVLQNNKLIRSAQDLIGRPGVGIRDNNTGKLQAWAFLGADGAVRILHVMPDHRRKGFGRKVIVKMLQQMPEAFPTLQDDWCHSDIAAENAASIGLYESLGYQRHWNSYWIRIDLSRLDI